MIFDCIFCGSKVEREAIGANGFCDNCNLAQQHAKIISDKIKADQGLGVRVYLRGKEVFLTKEEIDKAMKESTEAWFNSIIYGDSKWQTE